MFTIEKILIPVVSIANYLLSKNLEFSAQEKWKNYVRTGEFVLISIYNTKFLSIPQYISSLKLSKIYQTLQIY